MLNRLMYLYFLQKRGYLPAAGGDPDYLARCLRAAGPAHSFYRSFLRPLFSVASRTLTAQEASDVPPFPTFPACESSLFAAHALERAYPELQIPDSAFARLFAFFDAFAWRSATVQDAGERLVSPAILGALFEQQTDRKQSGSYYTSADVAEYIGATSIIPCLFESVRQQHPAAFAPGGPIWSLLTRDPDRFIYPAASYGCALALPPEIAAGSEDPARRQAWDGLAPSIYALPQETWRETIARRQCYAELRARIHAGTLASMDELIACNLDLRRFAAAVIRDCEDATLLSAFYSGLSGLSVLDPTCGSGAFLQAALRILEPLYIACLQRMQALVGGQATPTSVQVLVQEVSACANLSIWVRRAILTRNLYGTEIRPEVSACCKLGLFLHLCEQDQTILDAAWPPLLDLHLRAGDALGDDVPPTAQAETGARPIHWETDFPEVMARGGFDVVIGNPPYVADRAGRDTRQSLYRTAPCRNLCAYTMERALALLRPDGRCGMIVPVSVIASERYRPLSSLLLRHPLWVSAYSNRPGQLFSRVEQRVAILLLRNALSPTLYAAPYRHWYEAERAHLFSTLSYIRASIWEHTGMPLKSGTHLAETIFARLARHTGSALSPGGQSQETAVWVHDGPTYWVRALPFEPNSGRGSTRSSHYHRIPVGDQRAAFLLAAILSSSTFYLFYTLVSNGRDLGSKELQHFPLGQLSPELAEELATLGRLLARRLQDTAVQCVRHYASGEIVYEEYYPARAKVLLDEIDRVLARHYGFSEEEVDFLLHYKEKYRLGRDQASRPPA
ncbi:MAG TPA: DNA methyltransferase [Ktedonobacteraceae bacterium]|jgi:hypothetical protein